MIARQRTAFHYHSSIMWRPPAGLAGGHLCTVRSTAQAIHATSKQFSTTYASLNPSGLALSALKGCWTPVCSDCLDRGGFSAAGRRVSQREDVTGLPTAILARATAEAAGWQQLSCHSCRSASLQLSCYTPGTFQPEMEGNI